MAEIRQCCSLAHHTQQYYNIGYVTVVVSCYARMGLYVFRLSEKRSREHSPTTTVRGGCSTG